MRALLAAAALGGTTLTAGITTFMLTRVDPRPETSAAERFVPSDGSSFVTVTDESPPSYAVLENARFSGELALFYGSTSVGELISDVLGDGDRTGLEVWRGMRHSLDEGGDIRLSTVVYRLDETGVALLADHSAGLGFIYDPPLLVLPADVATGVTWTIAGDALPQGAITYALSGEVLGPTAIDDDDVPWDTSGCVDVEASSTYTDPATDFEYFTIAGVETWCPGLGSMRSAYTIAIRGVPDRHVVETSAAMDRAETVSALPPFDPQDPADTPTDWDQLEQWEITDIELLSGDPLFGDNLLVASNELHPVVSDGAFLFVNGSAGDLAAADTSVAAVVGSAPTTWLAHPGGRIIAIGGSDQLVAVATVDKRVVAYGLDGVRRWEVELSDLSIGDPAVAPDLSVAITSLDGTVRVIESDGTTRWVRDMPVDVAIGPAVSEDIVVAIDRGGNVVAFDLLTGEQRWSNRHDGSTALAIAEGVVVLSGGDELIVLELATGEQRWSVSPDGFVSDVAVSDSTVVAVGDATEAYDLADGERLWTRQRAEEVLARDGRIVVFVADRAIVLDETGAELASWQLAAASVASSRFEVATADAIWIISDGLAVQRLGGG